MTLVISVTADSRVIEADLSLCEAEKKDAWSKTTKTVNLTNNTPTICKCTHTGRQVANNSNNRIEKSNKVQDEQQVQTGQQVCAKAQGAMML